MWIYQKAICIVLLAASTNSNPYDYKGYAPSHNDYKGTDYQFSYGVKDYHTGDVKHQWEKKDGDTVKGQYSLVEPDGSIRTVDYTADKHSGFNAVVKHSGSFKHPIQSKEEPSSHNEVILIPKQEFSNKEQEYYPYSGDEDASKYEAEGHDEDDTKYQYAYVPQEEAAEESQHSAVKSKSQNPGLNSIRHHVSIKEEYEKILPELPIDLSLIKNSPVEPVDVSLLNPVEVNIKEQARTRHRYKNKYSAKDTSLEPSHELTEEEISKYLEEYYKNKQIPVEPEIETGFKPIKTKSKTAITQPIPGTFKSNKKPARTPGLSTYSSGNPKNKFSRRNPKLSQLDLQNSYVQVPYFHYYIPKENVLDKMHQSEITRLYRSLPNSAYFRYAKHVNVEE